MQTLSTSFLRPAQAAWEKGILRTMHSPGVYSFRDLQDRGYSRADIERLMRDGKLLRFARGWYASPTANSWVMRAITLGGRLGCLTGCEYYGLWTPRHHELHVIHHPGVTPAPAPAAVFHRSMSPQGSFALWPLDSCLEHVLRFHDTESALIVIESALNMGLIDTHEVQALCARHPNRGTPILTHLDRAESGSETRVRYFLRRLPFAVRSQVEIDGVGRVDLLAGNSLIIECDSNAHHSSNGDYVRDRRRDLAARDQGFQTIRLSYDQMWYDWAATQESLLRQLRTGHHLKSPHQRRAQKWP